jgi:hypothetical protein
MSQVAPSALISTLSRVGLHRISKRVARRVRYRWVYPWAARYLFPMVALKDDGFVNAMTPRAFRENSAVSSDSHARLMEEAETLRGHRFGFLNVLPVDLGTPVDWRVTQNGDPLWKYNLHYGEWALTLAHAFLISGEDRFRDSLIGLMGDWIENHRVGQDPGWQPYPTSRRLLGWSRVGLAMKEDKRWQAFWRSRLAPSLFQQASVLEKNLEHDLANNHLVSNYRALAWMGLIFPGWPEAGHWRDVGLGGLWEEMRRQVLSDGVHNERSISYHTIVLHDLLETWRLARQTGTTVPEDVQPTLMSMLQFLADTQTPEGTWPMVNDSVPDYPVNPGSALVAGAIILGQEEWLCHARRGEGSDLPWLTGERSPDSEKRARDLAQMTSFPNAGYVVLRDKARNYLFFDAGPMGPESMPGHGHADALSFILYGGGRPLVVDPGVYSYHDTEWRDYFRGTSAHNTVTVDNNDQCVFWGPFRVAYPPKARLLEWSENHVVGEHEGYRRLKRPVIHRRRIERKASGEWELTDYFDGSGDHDFALSLQFSIGAKVELSGSNGEIRWPDGVCLQVDCPSPPPGATATIERGWVSPGWNLKDEAPRYVHRWHARAPLENRLILKVSNQ